MRSGAFRSCRETPSRTRQSTCSRNGWLSCQSEGDFFGIEAVWPCPCAPTVSLQYRMPGGRAEPDLGHAPAAWNRRDDVESGDSVAGLLAYKFDCVRNRLVFPREEPCRFAADDRARRIRPHHRTRRLASASMHEFVQRLRRDPSCGDVVELYTGQRRGLSLAKLLWRAKRFQAL